MSVTLENKNVEKRAGNRPAPKVEFGMLDPRTLLVETNVRAEANLTPRFLKSIRDNGVLTPILVQRPSRACGSVPVSAAPWLPSRSAWHRSRR